MGLEKTKGNRSYWLYARTCLMGLSIPRYKTKLAICCFFGVVSLTTQAPRNDYLGSLIISSRAFIVLVSSGIRSLCPLSAILSLNATQLMDPTAAPLACLQRMMSSGISFAFCRRFVLGGGSSLLFLWQEFSLSSF